MSIQAGPNDTMVFNNQHDAQVARLKAWEERGGGAVAFPLSFYTNELFGEFGEAANIIKKLHRERAGAPGSRSTVEALLEELADGMICLRNLAIKMQIDIDGELSGEFEDKLLDKLNTLSDYGTYFGVCMGMLCTMPLVPEEAVAEGTELSKDVMVSLRQTVWRLVEQEAPGISFNQVIADKWNKTSEANDLPHRVQLTYSLEETFK
jgi:NTP pyrophosphatase (non-canonical NTP hydrolase)